MNDKIFQQINSDRLCTLIADARKHLCYAAPGIQLEPAQAIVALSKIIGVELIYVFLDISENVMRMGYGEVEAICLLKNNGIQVQHIAGLRNGLIVSDDIGFSYTPTALFLERDDTDGEVLNSMRLMPNQIQEAMARLSPASKAIALAQADTAEQVEKINSLSVETKPQSVTEQTLNKIDQNLKSAPPVSFDIARQVRVFQPYFQYVEMSLTGAAIQRKKLEIPKSIQNIGGSKELEGRLKTTFDLISKDALISSKGLDDELHKIRTDFTRSLGGKHGRIILISALDSFAKKVALFRETIAKHSLVIEEELQNTLVASQKMIVKYYLPLVIENPPDKCIGEIGVVNEQNVEKWLEQEVNAAFPKVESLIQNIQFDVNFKDVTFDTLNKDDFLETIKRVYPKTDWDKTYKDFLAAGEKR